MGEVMERVLRASWPFVFALCFGFALVGVVKVATLFAKPSTTISQHTGRFGIADMTVDHGREMWVMHDRAHPDQCVLVVEYHPANGNVTLTSQPWPCS